MRFSCEMLSISPGDKIAAYPNKIRMHVDDSRPGGVRCVYLEAVGIHGGTQVITTVCVEAAVLAYHLRASGVLS